MATNVEPDRADEESDDEWQAESPGLELLLCQRRRHGNTDDRGENRRHRLRSELPAGRKATAIGQVFDHERGR
jgi:hypothetical protein